MTSNSKLFKSYLHRQSTLLENSLQDIDFIAKSRSEWNAMTPEEKLIYANTDTNPRVKSKPGDAQYMSNEPRLQSSIDLDLEQEIEYQIINSLVSFKDMKQLMDTKFFFMASNVQCLAKGEYRPIEIGIIEYTIRDGIRRDYHQFIDCGPVPLGFSFPARDHMNRTHKIPLEDFILSSKDYQQIGSRVLDFLFESCPNDRTKQVFDNPLIVFSKSDQLRQNFGSLKWIEKMTKQVYQKSSQNFKLNAKVLSASKLLAQLLMAAKEVRTLNWCEDVLSTSVYDYTTGTDCAFHEEIHCIECGLGVAKRIAYSISNCLMKSFNIKLKPTHIPVVKFSDNYQMEPEMDSDCEDLTEDNQNNEIDNKEEDEVIEVIE